MQSSMDYDFAEVASLATCLIDVGNRLRAQGRTVTDLNKPGPTGSSMLAELDRKVLDTLLSTLRNSTHAIMTEESRLSLAVQEALDSLG